ncbi:MAG: hypothetical protein H7336_09120 [Bacteriovorax sp.]|nr:hypothetical protein [Bacteriovorax sp.]
MLDNQEINRLLEILENCEDEVLAVKLLQEFNCSSKHLGKLLLNLDKTLSHDEWKRHCDVAQKEVNEVVAKIKSL